MALLQRLSLFMLKCIDIIYNKSVSMNTNKDTKRDRNDDDRGMYIVLHIYQDVEVNFTKSEYNISESI